MPTFLNSNKGVHNPQKKEEITKSQSQKELRELIKKIYIFQGTDEEMESLWSRKRQLLAILNKYNLQKD